MATAREGSGCLDWHAMGRVDDKEPMNDPKSESQLVVFLKVTSDGFDSSLANEPDSGAKSPFHHSEKRPAAFWKNPKESRNRKLGWKESASSLQLATHLPLPALPIPGLMSKERLLNLPDLDRYRRPDLISSCLLVCRSSDHASRRVVSSRSPGRGPERSFSRCSTASPTKASHLTTSCSNPVTPSSCPARLTLAPT